MCMTSGDRHLSFVRTVVAGPNELSEKGKVHLCMDISITG